MGSWIKSQKEILMTCGLINFFFVGADFISAHTYLFNYLIIFYPTLSSSSFQYPWTSSLAILSHKNLLGSLGWKRERERLVQQYSMSFMTKCPFDFRFPQAYSNARTNILHWVLCSVVHTSKMLGQRQFYAENSSNSTFQILKLSKKETWQELWNVGLQWICGTELIGKPTSSV